MSRQSKCSQQRLLHGPGLTSLPLWSTRRHGKEKLKHSHFKICNGAFIGFDRLIIKFFLSLWYLVHVFQVFWLLSLMTRPQLLKCLSFCLEFFNFWTLFVQLVLPWICREHDYLQENMCLLFIVYLSFPVPIILRPAVSKGDLPLAAQCHCEWQERKDSELTHRDKESSVEDEVEKSSKGED